MIPPERQEFSELLTATMEVYGARMTSGSIAIWWSALERYPLVAIRAALSTHVRTPQRGTFAPKPADIIEYLHASDGRPGPEEAWAEIAHGIGNENATMVWTDEMRHAFFIAEGASEDKIAARMAFKEAYVGALREARAQGKPIKWDVSLGHDRHGREGPLLLAVQRGRLTVAQAYAVLPFPLDAPMPPLIEEASAAITRKLPLDGRA